MDIGTIGGILAGFALILAGIFTGGASLVIYWDLPSVFITLGGSFAALLVTHPVRRVLSSFKYFNIATRIPKMEVEKLIRILVDYR